MLGLSTGLDDGEALQGGSERVGRDLEGEFAYEVAQALFFSDERARGVLGAAKPSVSLIAAPSPSGSRPSRRRAVPRRSSSPPPGR
ncbi:hypothetical protein [Streptomyces roseolus]|uniref:hypothetical protein n=1 Tax=Streptomyces roseolus TaxID=67358 RepID=UPI00167714E8|nr:hypothetical protein [Streptomyces roseolus]